MKEVAAFGTPRKKAKKKGVSKATEEGGEFSSDHID